MQGRVSIARILLCLALVVPAAAASGCGDSPVSPDHTAPFSQTDVRVGTGAEAVVNATLSVNYTGWLYDASKPEGKGQRFDSSIGGDPLTFIVGVGGVIKGWDQGVPGMRVGGLRRLIIPPSLAYGPVRNGPIPPNSTLIFDVELLSVQ